LDDPEYTFCYLKKAGAVVHTDTAFIIAWVEVPDLKKGKLAMSGIFLGKLPKQLAVPPGGLPDASASKPAEPIAGRALFKRGEGVSYRFVVYNATEGDTAATVKTEIVQGETPVYTKTAPLATRTLRKDEKGIEAGGQLSLGLEPGLYTLRISVTDRKSKKPVQQSVDFEMSP